MAVIAPLAAADGEGFAASGGASMSQYSELSPFGQVDLIGVLLEARVSLPWRSYGLVQVRSEDGEGVALGGSTQNDYLRVMLEGGFEFPLLLGFRGLAGLNYTQADMDIGASLGGDPVSLAVSREAFGLRLGLARDLWGWARLAADLEVSPVDDAVGAVFDFETGRRFGPWSLALRYGAFPELTQAAAMLRFRFPHQPVTPAEPPPPLPTSIPQTVEGRVELAIDSQWTAPPDLPVHRSWWSSQGLCPRPRQEAAGCAVRTVMAPNPSGPLVERPWHGPRPR